MRSGIDPTIAAVLTRLILLSIVALAVTEALRRRSGAALEDERETKRQER